MTTTIRTVLSVGQFDRRLNEPLHHIDYAIKTRNITPIGIAGNAWIFGEEHLEQIAAALRNIDHRHEADRDIKLAAIWHGLFVDEWRRATNSGGRTTGNCRTD